MYVHTFTTFMVFLPCCRGPVELLLAVAGHTPQDSSRPGAPQAFLSTPLERSWSIVLPPVELHSLFIHISLSHGATEVPSLLLYCQYQLCQEEFWERLIFTQKKAAKTFTSVCSAVPCGRGMCLR